jgi:serine/threonine protein phosphatase PrpC
LAAHIVSECEPGEPVGIPVEAVEIWAYTRTAPDKDSGNEDRAGVFPCGGSAWVLAVADGLGGMPSGDEAARIAVGALAERLRAAAPGSPLRTSILDAFEDANQRILALGGGAGTTFAVAEIDDDRLRTYHVGDSAILVVGQRGRIKVETIAHSPVGYGVAAGLIEPEAAMHHDDRHFLSNHLGASDMHIQVGSPVHLAERDTVLLATDGVFDNLHVPEIVERIRKGPLRAGALSLARTCVERMAAEAGESPAKPDDATFVVMRPRQRGRATPGDGATPEGRA